MLPVSHFTLAKLNKSSPFKAVQTTQSGETNKHNFLKISFNNWL